MVSNPQPFLSLGVQRKNVPTQGPDSLPTPLEGVDLVSSQFPRAVKERWELPLGAHQWLCEQLAAALVPSAVAETL